MISCCVTNHPKVKTIFVSHTCMLTSLSWAILGVIERLDWAGCSGWLIHITGSRCWLWVRNSAGAVNWTNYTCPLHVPWIYHSIMAGFLEGVVHMAQIEAIRLLLPFPQHSYSHFCWSNVNSQDQSRFQGKGRDMGCIT